MSEIGFVQADKLVPLAGRLTLGDFSILKVIGKGGMGKVMLVRHRASGRMYALKSIHKQWILAHGQLQHAKSERAIMAAFRESFNVAECTEENLDKFLIKLHASFQTTTELFYVLDFHPGGDLASILAHHVRLGEGRAKFYAVEIAVGLGLLHSKGIVYRDLKPENVLLDARGHVVLTDFGLSKMLQNESESEPQTVAATLCGTAEYLAPEILRREPYDQSVDWWSFGVMLYEMIVGTTPFWNPSPQRMYLNILTLPRIEFPVWVSPEARDLIAALLNRSSQCRPSYAQVRGHSFFKEWNWEDVEGRKLVPPFVTVAADLTAAFDSEFTNMPAQITPADVEIEKWLKNPQQQEQFTGFSYYP